MKKVEYEPLTDLDASRQKIQILIEAQVEIPDQVLYECIQDVLASRGGKRWKNLDELNLSTKLGMEVGIGYYDQLSPDEPWSTSWIEITDLNGQHRNYAVRRWLEHSNIYELNEIESESGEGTPINNIATSGLASARLLSILADAHINSPLEELSDDYYHI